MNNQLPMQIFKNIDFGQVRVFLIDGQPWFVGKDVAEILGYSNTRKAIGDHVDLEDKGVTKCDTLGGLQEMTIINESGLYSLIFSSKLQTAKAFKCWVTGNILPSIRKYGAYITDDVIDKMLQNSEYAHNLLLNIKANNKKIASMQEEIKVLAPKARYYDVILQSKNAIPISLIAKDYGQTAVAFNLLLHDLGIQYKVGGAWVLYKPYDSNGYTISRTYTVSEGKSVMHTYWTQKGRLFLYETLKMEGILPLMEMENAFQTELDT